MSYLSQYWPEECENSKVWQENRWLLKCYIEVAKILNKDKQAGKGFQALEISTGPTLAPLIPFLELLDSIQLSDYSPTNRKILRTIDINYWKKYIVAVLKLENKKKNSTSVKRRLALLDNFRKQKILDVDIKAEKPFPDLVNYEKFNLFIMHFVADSITENKREYYDILKKVLKMLNPSNHLIMSSLIDCKTWDDGVSKYPSPKLSIKEIETFLLKNNFDIKFAKQSHIEHGVGLDGGMGVILAQKKASI